MKACQFDSGINRHPVQVMGFMPAFGCRREPGDSMRISTAIFDMDGLMIDSERITYAGYRAVLAESGRKITEDFYLSLLGRPMADVGRCFAAAYGAGFPFAEIAKQVHRFVADSFVSQGVPVKAGLLPLLDYLRAAGCTMLVATSSDRSRVDKILSAAGISEYFDGAVCGDEVQKGKPDPEVFLACCRKANCRPDEALVFEDAEPGILAAHRANIACVAVPDMKEPGEEYREMTLLTAGSLTEALNELKARADIEFVTGNTGGKGCA